MTLLFVTVFTIITTLIASAIGLISRDLRSAEDFNSPLLLLGPMLGITLATWIARRYLDRRSFLSLGLRWEAHSRSDLLFGIFMPALLFGLILLFELAMGWLEFEASPFAARTLGSILWRILGASLLYVIVGYQEELLSRGYHLQNFVDGLNLQLGVFFSSAIFSVLHAGNPGASIMSTAGILLAGFFLAFAWIRTGSLWLPIGIHIGWNFFQGTIFGFPVSGTGGFHLLRHVVDGPTLFTGGVFGPEAGLTGFAGMVLGSYLIYRYTADRSPLDRPPTPDEPSTS
jgi:membrane protease YdiL (CAAX protease family)